MAGKKQLPKYRNSIERIWGDLVQIKFFIAFLLIYSIVQTNTIKICFYFLIIFHRFD